MDCCWGSSLSHQVASMNPSENNFFCLFFLQHRLLCVCEFDLWKNWIFLNNKQHTLSSVSVPPLIEHPQEESLLIQCSLCNFLHFDK